MNEMVQPTLKIVNYEGMQITTTGLVPGGKVSKEGILAHLIAFRFYQSALNWCIGDLILEGDAAFGEDWMRQALADHLGGVSESTQMQCQWVSQRFPHDKRLNWLSWSHHLATAGMDDEDERTLLLESCIQPSEDAPGRSEDQPMGVSELRRAVRATRTDAEDDGEDEEGKLLRLARTAVLRLGDAGRNAVGMWITLGCHDDT